MGKDSDRSKGEGPEQGHLAPEWGRQGGERRGCHRRVPRQGWRSFTVKHQTGNIVGHRGRIFYVTYLFASQTFKTIKTILSLWEV